MVQTVQVQENGNAPSGLGVGDIVRTQGGDYIIATPGAEGASYNPESDYWSVRLDSPQGAYEAAAANARELAELNTQRSQEFAREQMQFQETANARAMAFNAEEAQKNRDWQELMSNTAHQREVADLVAAGLNPILSANNGAAVGSGATASGVTSSGASGTVDNSAVNSRMNMLLQLAQMSNAMKMTQISADAGLKSALASAGAVAYAAELSSNATIEASENSLQNSREQRDWDADHPNNWAQALVGFFNDLIGPGEGADGSDGKSNAATAASKIMPGVHGAMIDKRLITNSKSGDYNMANWID